GMSNQAIPRRNPPWNVPRGLDAVLAKWVASSWVKPCIAAEKDYPSRGSDTRSFPSTLAPELRRALEARGVKELYSHQAEALQIAAEGRSFVVATPTASGKSLCFHLPVLQA